MSDQKKQERDFTPEVDVALPEAIALAKVRFALIVNYGCLIIYSFREASSTMPLTSSLPSKSRREMYEERINSRLILT